MCLNKYWFLYYACLSKLVIENNVQSWKIVQLIDEWGTYLSGKLFDMDDTKVIKYLGFFRENQNKPKISNIL